MIETIFNTERKEVNPSLDICNYCPNMRNDSNKGCFYQADTGDYTVFRYRKIWVCNDCITKKNLPVVKENG